MKYITGNDTSAIGKKDFSEVLTLWDEVRLNMICIKFKHAYGYPCTVPDFEQFSRTFQQEMLKENFKFCDIVQQVLDEDGLPEDHYDVNQYVKNCIRHIWIPMMIIRNIMITSNRRRMRSRCYN